MNGPSPAMMTSRDDVNNPEGDVNQQANIQSTEDSDVRKWIPFKRI